MLRTGPSKQAFHSYLSKRKAILDSVQDGIYPDSEEVISADFPPSAFSGALRLLDEAQGQIKTRISVSSRDSAQDIDGWISQAKQLRADIHTAQQASHDILIKAERGRELQQEEHDARNKMRLLEGELAFNQSLAAVLEQVDMIRRQVSHVQDLLDQDELGNAIEASRLIEKDLAAFQGSSSIRAVTLLKHESNDLRQALEQTLSQRWYTLFSEGIQGFTLSLPEDNQCEPWSSCLLSASGVLIQRTFTAATMLASSLQMLGLLDGHVVDLANQLRSAILEPRLQLQAEGHEQILVIDNEGVKLSQQLSPPNIQQLFHDLTAFIGYLQKRLPTSIYDLLSRALAPDLVKGLISWRLSSTIPEELDALQKYNGVREIVHDFAGTLTSYRWPGEDQLRSWVHSIPDLWLKKRQQASLDKIRQLLKRGYGEIRTVERVETQVLSHQDQLFTANNGNDDWNAEWSEDEETNIPSNASGSRDAVGRNDEEDVSAWGLDDEGDEENRAEKAAPSANDENDDDEGEVWGWGDDKNVDVTQDSPTIQRRPRRSPHRTVNGHANSHKENERELTLKESYNITSLPQGIFDLISEILSDANTLNQTLWEPRDMTSNPLQRHLAQGLLALPSHLLVMFRASASTYYSIDDTGNMFLYNNCLWLADQLRQTEHSTLKMDDDLTALVAYGKRSYGKAMESQRTILKDMLDGAQGFANCTEPPFAQECDLAITSIVDRLRDVHRQWKDVLSHSALMQSIGSLLSTVIDKLIIDIEDMSDISEPESQRLTAYCKQIIALEDLFLPQDSTAIPSTGQQQPEAAVPLPAVYAPGWFKFQYLSEILDSSLVDIKYLWTDGGLKLEYDAEEVVELIEALFADSEHRRRAIGEIRRASRV
ncbi:MAG: hypothetical protein Q9220_002361 [cf. Caloplaca sp. 1 TL-2023]